ncbi:MAG: hypothetical protein R3272_01390 [Candidatus Promineifilaceae bacterium]|nr:hypothetical protein [Candidatus Promineifilaceae bacterium]
MKALVFWCRWHDATIRLHGRDPDTIWGELAFPEESKPFHYAFADRKLVIGAGENAETLWLDEMGVTVDAPDAGGEPTSG